MLQLSNITKRFGPLTALDAVSLRLDPASVHGLLGENGAGKSTLMNILFGLLRPDSGSITIHGQPVAIRSPRIAQSLGIGMVHQHFKLVPTLTVAENFSLSLHAPLRQIKARAAVWQSQLQWQLPLDTRIDRLSVGQQQRVEIIKALLATDCGTAFPGGGPPGGSPVPQRTLIFDEPTAVLTPQETAELFAAIGRLRDGGAAIIFISHKLAEVQKICDTVTILRRGRHIHSGPAGGITPAAMTQMMVGEAVESPTLNRSSNASLGTLFPSLPPALQLSNLSAGILKNASLTLHRGEILGIAGVDGNGQSDLIQAIIGGIPITSGQLSIAGIDATRAPIRWRIDRLAYVAEDRQTQAMILPLSIRDNLLLKEYRKEPFSTLGWLRFAAWRSHSSDLIRQFDVRCNSIADAAGQLSGGNQQKMVLARELHDAAKPLVIAANPTRGLDVGATAFVMRQLLAARARGAGVLLIHNDLDELLAISDRVLVLYSGTLTDSGTGIQPVAPPSKESIGHLMLGLPPDSPSAHGAA